VQIAGFLPGRTGNDVKNRWHKHLLKKYGPPRSSRGAQVESTEPEHEPGLHPSGPPPRELSGFLQFVLN
jgi:hypothetical protein